MIWQKPGANQSLVVPWPRTVSKSPVRASSTLTWAVPLFSARATTEPLGWLAKYKRAPCDSSTRLPCRAYAAHAALTVSLLSVRLLSTTGRLLTQAQVAVKVLPWCKLSGTTRYDGPGRNQQSTDTELRFRRCAVASSTTAGGACPPPLPSLSLFDERSACESTRTSTKPRQARGSNKLEKKGPWRMRGSGCTKLKQHSVVSKASNAMAVQAKSMLGICTVSRASSQTPSRILQIVQCAKFCKKSRRPMKKTPGRPPAGTPSCWRNSGVQRELEFPHGPSHSFFAYGFLILRSLSVLPPPDDTSKTSKREYT
mmetsp:Transcript_116610/g.291176  ORF Transcript_116610/g.291176 Transcript_116610/m.291176 type:complete len:312 (-) Transcript_116610:485-1420(-)